MQEVDIINAIFVVAILIFSVVAHEVSHGYMAQRLGDPTARFAGRLTMNPLKHLDFYGSFLVPVFTYFATFQTIALGWAKPVPYNPYNLRDQKWGETKVALAGPLMNVFIAVFFGLLFNFFGYLFSQSVLILILKIVQLNVGLAIFNLVPLPPLDGSKVLLDALPVRFRYIGDYLERYYLFLLLVFVFFLWPYVVPLVKFITAILTGLPLESQ